MAPPRDFRLGDFVGNDVTVDFLGDDVTVDFFGDFLGENP